MARPIKLKKELKSKHLNVWMTDNEYTFVLKKAKFAGLSGSSFLLNAALNKTINAPAPLLNMKGFGQLANIGNNLNQLSRKANLTGFDDELFLKASELVNELKQLMVQIKANQNDK